MKSVVLCGSTRFKPEIRRFASELKNLGVVVFEPHLHRESEEAWASLPADYQKFVALGLTFDHFQKIRTGDVVFIYNKNGYMGNSCTLELGFAVAANKPIYALAHDKDEICRDSLIKEVVKTPSELVERLK
ncbi:MAG: nucleoside 2-deoxyribosyltransferase [Candidatus Nomurabacteria bacterium]|jgi:nucleoside 2-deoxyribosyltransferase|nr:nucleoside 2-deoxyribosyltransferase [Candidatus Nomurabacteria bacterium]